MPKNMPNEIKDLPVWFASLDIYYNRVQVELFILPHLEDLRNGDYPSEPAEYKTWVHGAWVERKRSSYVGTTTTSARVARARFISAAEIAAELDARLNLINCKPPFDVSMLLAVYSSCADVETIARDIGIEPRRLLNELNRMLNFITGWKRSQVNYQTWLRIKRKSLD